MEKELGKVDRVDFGREDHGILTCFVHIDFGGTHQGFGGYRLDGHAAGMDWIVSLLDLFGVSNLESIVGKPVYGLRDEKSALLIGLETPKFDGGRKFLIADWQKKWFPQEKAE